MTCQQNQPDVNNPQHSSAQIIDNQLWSINRLAEYLDVPAATVKDWVYKRQIPFVKAGRHVRFKYSDVQKWLTEKGCGDGHQKD